MACEQMEIYIGHHNNCDFVKKALHIKYRNQIDHLLLIHKNKVCIYVLRVDDLGDQGEK